MRILVTGGAGYIGSHTCVALIERGYEPIILDNFSNSKLSAIDAIEKIAGKKPNLYKGDLCDKDFVDYVLRTESSRISKGIHAVIHFAGHKAVAESFENPIKYYSNNVIASLNLIAAMKAVNIKNLVFSSSATVYSTPMLSKLLQQHPKGITEEFPLGTNSPYGMTKLIIEQIIEDACKADPCFNVGILRYFNPIGAHSSGIIGENPNGIPNNLLPYIAKVAMGQLPVLNIFGNDYPTADGTCIRDYIHVMDLAEGHISMLERLKGLQIFNLGSGKGYSVLDIVREFEKVNDVKIPYAIKPRRNGDIASSYADPDKAEKDLAWKAKYGIEEMCRSAWNFNVLYEINSCNCNK